ncbi:MAG: adenosine deaminase [Candidatus Bathyarchaeia archaeon]
MMKLSFIERFIRGIPKAELHLHIEGTLEPEMMFEIAERNNIKLRYRTAEEVRRAYVFRNLSEFLNVYYEGVSVLLYEEDFYDLTWAYLEKAYEQNVTHVEVFFDPQAHIRRGVSFDTVICGIHKALEDAEHRLGISSRLIMCFLRDLPPEDALDTFREALAYKDWITAVGLDSAEVGNPPSKFRKVFEEALKEGFLTVAHAGEEGPADYVWEALNLLKVSRIDHGNRAVEDPKLMAELARRRIPLTLCPLSNLKLGVVKQLEEHPLKFMMEKGLLVTINSDDPAYFGGYVAENYMAVQNALGLTLDQITTLAKNSFEASFLNEEEKAKRISKVEEYKRIFH